MKRLIIVSFFVFSVSIFAYSLENEVLVSVHSSQDADFKLIKAAESFNHPWAFTFLPDKSVFIPERRGRLVHFKNGKITEIPGLPDIPAKGQGGLLDIVLHPEFKTNRLVYFSHSALIGDGTGTAVSRAYFTGKSLINVERIFTSNIGTGGSLHYGSRLVFDHSGFLYITLGERGESRRAQNINDHAGSVLRIKEDGSIPSDNPFVLSQGLAEIYSFGHRNPQGMAVDPLTGEVWIHEHGPKGGDELNKIFSGANYGWPRVTYGVNYDGSVISRETEAPGIEPPELYWLPSIAPSGMTFYSGNNFPGWKNDIFAGALSGKHIRRIIRTGEEISGEEVLVKNTVGRIRDIRTGPDGNLWFITDEKNGGLYKIIPAD